MCFEQLQLLFPDYSALLDAHIFIVVFDLLQIQIEKKFYLYIEKSASGRASLLQVWIDLFYKNPFLLINNKINISIFFFLLRNN